MLRWTNTFSPRGFRRGVTRRSALLASVLAAATFAAQPVAENPRAFGYTVGDLIEQRITLPEKAVAKLPHAGRIGDWLTLREARIDRGMSGSTVHLVYQVIGAPRAPTTVFLPALAIEGVPPLEEWPVTLSPLTPNNVLGRGPLEELRPDWQPQPRVGAIAWMALALSAITAIAAVFAAWIGWLPHTVPWLNRRPFATGVRELARAGTQESPAAWKALHHAFDRTFGRAMHAGDIDAFIDAHPRFAQQRERIQAFYAASSKRFFAGDGVTNTNIDLNALARDLARTE